MASRSKASTIAANRARVRAGTLEKPSVHSQTVEEIAPPAGTDKPAAGAGTEPIPKRPIVKNKDLTAAATQWEILNPETMKYTLLLPDGKRPIEVKTVFSLGDIHNRRIFEDMQSFRMLVIGQARQFAQGDANALYGNPSLLSAALLRSIVREEARAIIVKIAHFTDVDEKSDEPKKPSIEQLEIGMETSDLAAFSMYLLNRVAEEEQNQKNARTAAPK